MPIGSDSKLKKSVFFSYFLNKDISFNIPCKVLRFDIHVHDGHAEGTMSQIFYIGLSFYFMKPRK